MKKLLLILFALTCLIASAQHYESNARAYVKIKKNKKIKTKDILIEKDTVCLSENLIIIRSKDTMFIDVEVVEETDKIKKWKGYDNDELCYIVLFKQQTPKSVLINYGEWGIIYFLD